MNRDSLNSLTGSATHLEARGTYWLSRQARSDLAECIVDLLDRTVVLPAVAEHLDNVLTELGVAEARNQMWPEKAAVVRKAHGLPDDVLPIRFSDAELNTVRSIATLPEPVRASLGGR